MAAVDTTALAAIVSTCFSWSQDATLPSDQRWTYYNLGLHLRAELVDAYTATFPDTDTRIAALNTQLGGINTDLAAEQAIESSYAQNVNKVTSALNILDQLFMMVPK